MRASSDQISMAEAVPPKRGIPDDEKVWVSYYNASGKKLFTVTSRSYREKYYLYSVNEDGSVKRLGESSSPLELEEKYNVHEFIQRG